MTRELLKRSDALGAINTLIESLEEGLMTDAGLSGSDRVGMRHQIEALTLAKDGIAALSHTTGAFGERFQPEKDQIMRAPLGARFTIDHDGFVGTVIGYYRRHDGKRGVVLQQDGTKVVHVYGEKWLKVEKNR